MGAMCCNPVPGNRLEGKACTIDDYKRQGLEYLNAARYNDAVECFKQVVHISKETDDLANMGVAYCSIGNIYWKLGQYKDAMKCHKEYLRIHQKTGDIARQGMAYCNIGVVHQDLGQYTNAMECHKEHLRICQETGDTAGKGKAYCNLGSVYQDLGQYKDAMECHKKQLRICRETGDIEGQGKAYCNIGIVHNNLGQYKDAMECYKKLLRMCQETGNIAGQGKAIGNIGIVHKNLGQYKDAMDCHKEDLRICQETGDISGQGKAYCNIGVVHDSLGQYKDAIKCHKEHLRICQETGDRTGEGNAHGNLGIVHNHLGQYKDAMECHKEHLRICQEAGNIAGQGKAYCNIGNVHMFLGQYKDAMECKKEHLRICQETGNIAGQGTAYGNIGILHQDLGQYKDAVECHEKQLRICQETGNILGQSNAYCNLGSVHQDLGQYKDAMECHKQQLHICETTGYIAGQSKAYCNIGMVHDCLGNYKDAMECYKESLRICHETGDMAGEANAHHNIGIHYITLNDKPAAESSLTQSLKYFEKLFMALQHNDEDKISIVDTYIKTYKGLAYVYIESGKTQDALFVLEGSRAKALSDILMMKYNPTAQPTETAEVRRENIISFIDSCRNSSFLIFSFFLFKLRPGMYTFVIERGMQLCFKETSREDIDVLIRMESHVFTLVKHMNGFARYRNISCEDRSVGTEDVDDQRQFKEEASASVNMETTMILGQKGELTEYSEEESTTCNEYDSDQAQVHATHDNLVNSSNSSSFLIFSFSPHEQMHMFVIASDMQLCFKEMPREVIDVLIRNQSTEGLEAMLESHVTTLIQYMNDFAKTNPDISCEDRSLGPEDVDEQRRVDAVNALVNAKIVITSDQRADPTEHSEDESTTSNEYQSNQAHVHTSQANVQSLFTSPSSAHKSPQDQDDLGTANPDVEKHNNGDQNVAVLIDDMLASLYKTMIGPVENELTQPDIAIIPEGPLFLVPFAALKNSEGRYLSDYKRIRVGPSLSTLKLLRECPDGNCKHGALVVGGPARDVVIRGNRKRIVDLPSAIREAEKIAEVLGETALTGESATKVEVLHRMQEGVAIIHIVTHCSTTGRILLAPGPCVENRIPVEEDHLLTINDIYSSSINARLVVLSCCHSGRGEIRAEGVVGLTRAFLAAGARSVLASLWAVDDRATLQFMEYFYGYLKSGQTASASLQQAMRKIRQIKKWRHPYYWAAFFIVGHDITLPQQ